MGKRMHAAPFSQVACMHAHCLHKCSVRTHAQVGVHVHAQPPFPWPGSEWLRTGSGLQHGNWGPLLYNITQSIVYYPGFQPSCYTVKL